VYLLGVGLALVALAFATTEAALASRAPGVTRANARRVRPGMTPAEAAAILRGLGDFLALDHHGADAESVGDWDCVGSSGIVRLSFRDGRVERAEWIPWGCDSPATDLLARLGAWLGW
jgi:hypothetical protein